MKKLLLVLALISGLTTAHAQLDPLTQFLNRVMVPDLVTYDSISVSLDSGAAFTTVAAGQQHYFTNGHIDTLTITNSGIPVIAYNGVMTGNKTVVTGVDMTMGGHDSIDRVTYFQDRNGQDSTMRYAQYASGFIEAFEARFFYDTDTLLSQIDIYVQGFGKLGDWRIFYDQKRPDSLYYTISVGGTGPGRMEFVYDSTNPDKLRQVETYEDIDGDGEMDLIQVLETKYNSQGKIDEINNLSWNTTTLSLELVGAYRYSVRANSTISLKEPVLANIDLYPNPVGENLKIISDGSFGRYEIYTISGGLVQEGNFSKEVNVSALPAGSYLIVLNGKTEKVSKGFQKL